MLDFLNSKKAEKFGWWFGAGLNLFLAILYGVTAVLSEPIWGMFAAGFVITGLLMSPPMNQPKWVRFIAVVVMLILAYLG